MKPIVVFVALAGLVAGCQSSSQTARTAANAAPPPPQQAARHVAALQTCGPEQRAIARSGLAGRTITVRRISDIKLAPKEVVLTFDDGPIPKKTPSILDTLDAYGVKATFFVVGQMARAYPHLVRKVAARGHSIGSHTENHPDLTKRSLKSALGNVAKGERSIATALSGSGHTAAPFFRFPYLAESAALRRAMAQRGVVVIGVDIDSKDYHRVSPLRVRSYTLKRLRARGRGIILFHDLHARTASMLPGFLAALKEEGYKVVHLAPPGAGRDPCPALSF